MIVNAVKEGIREGLENSSVVKELKIVKEELVKIKALNVKILKEQANIVQGVATPLYEEVAQPGRIPVKPKTVTYNTPNPYPAQAAQAKSQSQQEQQAAIFEAMSAVGDGNPGEGALPDMDIDPGIFLKKKFV
jgi:hypothetical protein